MEAFIEIEVSNKLKDLGAFLYYAVSQIKSIKCDKINELNSLINETINKIKLEYKEPGILKDVNEIKAYRRFLWKLKIDPTKTRPSSEALLRRILRGKNFPRINDIVDIGNVVSISTLVPIGLYDLDKLKEPLMLRLSLRNEIFRGIGNKEETLKEGIPVLADSEGKILHIYPHRDSTLTAVNTRIRRLLVVGAGVNGIDESLVRKSVIMVTESLLKFGCSEKYWGPWRSR